MTAPTEKAAVMVETVDAALAPNLIRDLAGFMTLLLIFISYHIQHPTLLLRSHFGRAFRGDSLQTAVGIALILSAGLLLWQVWQDTQDKERRVWVIAFGVGLGLYCAHMAAFLLWDWHIFLSLYGFDFEAIGADLRDEAMVNPVRALNMMALGAGAALASVVYLGRPWARPASPIRLGLMLAASVMVVLAFLAGQPLAEMRGGLAADLSASPALVMIALGLLGLTGGLAWVSLGEAAAVSIRRLKVALTVLALAYGLYALWIALGGANPIESFYKVASGDYAEQLGALDLGILAALDWGALLAGVAGVSTLYLIAPWERLRLYADVLRQNFAPLLIGIGAILAWEALVVAFEIEAFLIPRPSVIWNVFKEIYPRLIAAGWLTFQNALLGFMFGCGLGFLSGMVAARFTRFSRAILPLAIAANSVPIIAFAPIANLWFGVASIWSKVAIVAVLCYFPAMISTLRGLNAADTREIELMRSYAASELQILTKLRIPVALPFILSALKLSTTLAMIGAIVAEFFGGSFSGLGYLIRNDAVLFRFPASWSAIVVASLFGISFYLLIAALERALMPWYQSFRKESA